MSPRLVLVKHSLPTVDTTIASSEWHLAPEGIARCAALAERLRMFDARAIASSVEPKAAQTATIVAGRLNLPVEPVTGLHEHDRGDTRRLGDREYERAIASLFARPLDLMFGRETAATALARFAAAVTGVLERAPAEDDVIVVSHGTVISLYVAAHAGTDGITLWKRLGLPSFVVLDRASLGLERVVEAAG